MRRAVRPVFRPVALALLPGLVLLLSVAACRQTATPGRRDAAAAPGGPAAVRTVVDARAWLQDDTLPELEPLPGDADEPPLVVLERGTAPRELRLAPPAGLRQSLVVRAEQIVDEGVDAIVQRTDFTVRLTVELAMAEPTTDGGARGTLRIREATLEREPSEAGRVPVLREAVGGLAGATAQVQFGPYGDLLQVEWGWPEGGSDPVREAARMVVDGLALVTVPLPTQPVGGGGRWGREFRSGADSGLDATTRERFLLERMVGSKGLLRGRLRTRAGEQQLPSPADAAGVQVRLLELDLQDSIELTFDLGSLLPPQGRRALSSIQRRRRTAEGRTELLETRTRTLLEWEPAGDS